MSAPEQGSFLAECADVIHRFYRALDGGDYLTLARQMLPEGVWVRQGQTLEGRAAIVEALNKREPALVTTHIVNNLVVDRQDERTATASMYITVLRYEGDDNAEGPAPVPPIRAIQLAEDKLVLTDQGWQIAHKTARAIFRSAH